MQHQQHQHHQQQQSRKSRIIQRQATPHPRKATTTYQIRRYGWLVVGLFALALYGSYNDSQNISHDGNHSDDTNEGNAIAASSDGSRSSSSIRKATAIGTTTETAAAAVAVQQQQQQRQPSKAEHIDEQNIQAATQSYQTNQIHGIEFYWQLPEPRAQQNQPQGILFLAHPCHGSGLDWWPHPQDDSMSELFPPLPEHQAIVDMARNQLQLVVVTMSASEVKTKCWFGRDTDRVATVLKYLQNTLSSTTTTTKIDKEASSSPLPIYAMGFGSGGAFVSTTLPLELQRRQDAQNQRASSAKNNNDNTKEESPVVLTGYVSQLSGPKRLSPKARAEAASLTTTPPPGVFISMPRDVVTRTEIQTHIVQSKNKISGAMMKHIQLQQLPLDDSFFHQRLPHLISATLSRQLYTALAGVKTQNGQKMALLLDAKGKQFHLDPRKSMRQWNTALEPVLSKATKAEPQKLQHFSSSSHLGQLLNVAWGHNEVTRDGVLDAMHWLMSLHENDEKRQTQDKDQPQQPKKEPTRRRRLGEGERSN